jgi:hypothetical protein
MSIKEFRVEVVSYDELPKEIEKDGLSNNGRGREYARYLLIWHGNELVEWYSDAMEPEDVSFYRDLDWITSALERAYEQGVEDGILKGK